MSGFTPPAATPADIAVLQSQMAGRVSFIDDDDPTALLRVLDGAGREVWGIGLDGGPLESTARKIADATAPAILAQTGLSLDPSTDDLLLVRDGAGKIVFGIDPTGHLHPDLCGILASDLLGAPAAMGSIVSSVKSAITSTADVVIFGNSISAGVGVTVALRYAAQLSSQYGLTVVNKSVSGDKSQDIASRQGGLPLQLAVSGGSIPTSGPVGVTLRTDPNGQLADPVRFTSALVELTLFDNTTILGQLVGSGDVDNTPPNRTWTFTRSTAGAAITVGGAQLEARVAANDQYRGSTQIIWTPENNLGDPTKTLDVSVARVLADTAAMTGYLDRINPKYLVVGPLDRGASEGVGTSVGTAIRQIEQAFRARYGPRFVPMRQFMTYQALDYAGLTATSSDLADIAKDSIPGQIRQSNGIHPNDLPQSGMAWLLHLCGKRVGFWA